AGRRVDSPRPPPGRGAEHARAERRDPLGGGWLRVRDERARGARAYLAEAGAGPGVDAGGHPERVASPRRLAREPAGGRSPRGGPPALPRGGAPPRRPPPPPPLRSAPRPWPSRPRGPPGRGAPPRRARP